MIVAILAMAIAAPDCENSKTALARDECRLAQSMKIDPPPDCTNLATQFDMNVCSFRDYLRADIDLNRSWATTLKRWNTMSGANSLIASQRAWLTYRDKQCDVWAKFFEGGSIVSLAVNSCATTITKQRVKELNEMSAGLDH